MTRCFSGCFAGVAGFANEQDMIKAYTVLQAKSPTTQVLALVFERYNTSDIRYKIRHPLKIPNVLFQNTFDQPSYNTHTIYLTAMPFVQLQMCVDESFINRVPSRSINGTKVLQKYRIHGSARSKYFLHRTIRNNIYFRCRYRECLTRLTLK